MEKRPESSRSVETISFHTWGISILWPSRLRYLPRNYPTKVDLSSVRFRTIHLRGISQDIPQPPITKLRLKITHLIFHSNFQGHGRGPCTQKVPSRAKTCLWCEISMWKAVLKLVEQNLHVNQWTTMRISEIAIEIMLQVYISSHLIFTLLQAYREIHIWFLTQDFPPAFCPLGQKSNFWKSNLKHQLVHYIDIVEKVC